MKKPVLVIMAAGMGSRYGGLKQIDPVDKEGHIIMDFSLFDAKRAGFEKVIFIIKKENEDSFQRSSRKPYWQNIWRFLMYFRILTTFRKVLKFRKAE